MSLFDIPVKTIDGTTTTLEPFRGKMLLIVNVASRCGRTPQYAELESLYRRRKPNLVVLGFPCNQFGRQEPGTESEIREFCTARYGITFPLFAKIDVNGRHAHPLFRLLKSAKKGFLGLEAIGWNFTKFLVGQDGTILKRYGSRVSPETIEREAFAAYDR